MLFKRKAYEKLLDWKKNYADRYAVLLEGARSVGKSTIAENFARNEYRSYILIDFSQNVNNIIDCFEDAAQYFDCNPHFDCNLDFDWDYFLEYEYPPLRYQRP